jgi:hypothetical protein
MNAWKAVLDKSRDDRNNPVWVAAYQLTEGAIKTGVKEVVRAALALAPDTEVAVQADLLRDIFGPTLDHKSAIDPDWLTWNEGTVPRLAQAIYDERAWDQIPVLADALEDAGCADPAILSHCRESREHARGCWVVDLLLGKE